MLVNFLIVGTQKGGTTALVNFLNVHPNICMANTKEVHFFDSDRFFQSTNVNYGIYHKHFNISDAAIAVGEATPIYMYWKLAAKRIHEYNPQMKLIFILRNPIERSYSHYQMMKKLNKECLLFSDAIKLEQKRIISASSKENRWFSYIARGFYVEQIKNMLNYFPMEQMLFIKTEELMQHHCRTLGIIHDFLGVDRLVNAQPEVIFKGDYEPMQVEDRQFLSGIFSNEIKKLEIMLKWDCSEWKQ